MTLLTNLEAYYKIDETTGTNVPDSLESNSMTTYDMDNSDWVSGKIGNCLYFEGANGYVDGAPAMDYAAGSFSTWISNDDDGADKNILGRIDAGYQSGDFVLGKNTDNKLYLSLENSNTTYCSIVSNDAIPTDGTWVHVVCTWGAAGIKMYVNGVLQTDDDPWTSTKPSNDFYVGCARRDGGVYQPWEGGIDEFGIWSRTLTQDDVTELYNSGDGLSYSFNHSYDSYNSESISLTDNLSIERYNLHFESFVDNLSLSDQLSIYNKNKYLSLSEGISLSDEGSFSPAPAIGQTNQDTMYVNNGGTWHEFPYFDSFKINKKQNQMSEFEVTIYDISTAQKDYFKEQAEVLFFCGEIMVLKGKIQTIEYKSSYEVVAKGYGMGSELLNKQFVVDGDNRVQYDNISAQSIVTAINSDILTTQSSGIFSSDFGNISMRYEYGNRLNALGKTAEAMDYYWWVTQTNSDDYSTNYLNFASDQGETSSQKTFDLSNNTENIEQERDTSQLVNYIHALGYGDGVNQLNTSIYASSTQSSFLSSNIGTTNTSIPVSDVSVFDSTGSVRIAKEIVTYTGTSSDSLTGSVRGASSTTAKAHNKNCYIEQYYPTSSAQEGSSIDTYGIMDYTLIDKSIINEETLEVVASGYLSDHKEPIQIIKIQSDEPLTDASLNIGDNVTVTSSEANIDGNYRIVAQEFEDNYGSLTMKTQVSNRSLEFIEQMQKSKEESQNQSKYMQGATNIYSLNDSDNCDFVPGGASDAVYETYSSTVTSYPQALFFKPDGKKMYVAEYIASNPSKIYQYSLSTAWDVSTAYDEVYVEAQDVSTDGLFFSSDGTKMFEGGSEESKVYQYSLSTAWDLSTATYDTTSANLSASEDVYGIVFSTDGTNMYELGDNKVYQYSLSTAWDLSSASYEKVKTMTNANTRTFAFNLDGTKMFDVHYDYDEGGFYFGEYSLSTAWDISTLYYEGGGSEVACGLPRGLFYNNVSNMYVCGRGGKVICQYDLGSGSGHYLNVRFFIPNEAIAINKVLLNFKMKDYRADSLSVSNTPEFSQNSSGWFADAITYNRLTKGNNYVYNMSIDGEGNVTSYSYMDPYYMTWNYPITSTVTAPNIEGLFNKIKYNLTVYNGYNETKTPTINIHRGAEIIDTIYPTLSAWGYHFYEYEDEVDYRGTNYSAQISSSAGFDVNHETASDTSYLFSTATTFLKIENTLKYGIYEETLSDPSVDIYTGEDGDTLTYKGTYTTDQNELDLTSEIADVGAGKWMNIEFRPNKRMRIEANTYVQTFIKSE